MKNLFLLVAVYLLYGCVASSNLPCNRDGMRVASFNSAKAILSTDYALEEMETKKNEILNSELYLNRNEEEEKLKALLKIYGEDTENQFEKDQLYNKIQDSKEKITIINIKLKRVETDFIRELMKSMRPILVETVKEIVYEQDLDGFEDETKISDRCQELVDISQQTIEMMNKKVSDKSLKKETEKRKFY